MGASRLCSTGQLRESEAAGSRPSMVSQEVLRAIAHIKQQDPVQAEALERTLQIAESGLSRILGTQVSPLTPLAQPVRLVACQRRSCFGLCSCNAASGQKSTILRCACQHCPILDERAPAGKTLPNCANLSVKLENVFQWPYH